MCPACLCGGEAAGHNALRGSGPNQKHAFKDALTQAGSPDPRIDLVCITSSCPRQFLQNFKRRHRCLASPPLIALASTQTSLSHFDAAEWAPSTASEETALSRLARAAAAQRRLVAAAAQQERDARAAAAQRRLVAAAAQQDDWIRRWLKRQYEDALAAPLSPRLAALITQLETQDVSA